MQTRSNPCNRNSLGGGAACAEQGRTAARDGGIHRSITPKCDARLDGASPGMVGRRNPEQLWSASRYHPMHFRTSTNLHKGENRIFNGIGARMLQEWERGAAHAHTLKAHANSSAKPEVTSSRRSRVATDRSQCCWSNTNLYSVSPSWKLIEIGTVLRQRYDAIYLTVMRGYARFQNDMFSYVSLEQLVPPIISCLRFASRRTRCCRG